MLKDGNELDQEIKSIWKYPVYDGITSLKNYEKSKIRILWILKEANKQTPKESWNQREFHLKITDYKKWRATYQKMIYTSFGILNGISDLDDISDISKNSRIDKINVMEDLAVINVNKNGGTARANNNIIRDNYLENKQFLLKQIKLFEPDIIINASRVYELFQDLSRNNKIRYSWKFQYTINDNQLIVNCYHPNAIVSDSKYCNTIFKIVKEFSSGS